MRKYLVVLFLAAACGGSDSSGVALNDLAAKAEAAICKHDVECQSMPDTATCMASIQVNDTFLQTMVAAVNAKKAKYDSSLGGQCISEIQNQGCAFTGFGLTKTNPCQTMFTGQVAVGGACFESQECTGGGSCAFTNTSCNPNTACCTGTCQAAPAKAAIGQACQSTADCVSGAYCTDTTATPASTCQAIVTTSGGACGNFEGCADPMVCDATFNTMTGAITWTTCYTPAARMATCDPNKFIPCADQRDYCDGTTMKCTQNLTTGACQGANNAQCVGYESCTNNTCTPLVKAGGTCSTTAPNCLGDLGCPSGTCTLPTAMTCM